MILNVNTAAVEKFTKSLEGMRKSALPVAIRTTLNSAAFDVKKTSMPQSAKKSFVERKANFFKANSRVDMAIGFNIAQMKSVAGFIPGNKAVEELQQQEEGGEIPDRSFIPMDTARTGGSNKRMIRANARIAALKGKKVIDADKVSAKTAKQKFVRAAIKAYEHNLLVLGNKNDNGKRTLSRINNIRFNKKRRKININRTPLYTYQKGKVVKVKATNFMKRAAHESGLKLPEFFIKAAERQIAKYK